MSSYDGERFTLTATYDGEERTMSWEEPRTMDTDRLAEAFTEGRESGVRFGATLTAIQRIMNAAVDDEVWAKGEIELRNEAGELLHSMPAKG